MDSPRRARGRTGRPPVALVTGAGRGIGRATAEAFAADGYAVVIAERSVRSGRSAERAVRAAVRHFGRLDCVVNNAGVLTVAPLHRIARRDLEAMVRVNLLGPLLVARAALPVLRRRRRGAIVNVASILGKEGIGDFVAYCATKFGMIGFTEALADELRGTGVVVWAVCPGQIDAAMARKAGVTEGLIPPERVARVIVALATGRRRRPSGATVDITR